MKRLGWLLEGIADELATCLAMGAVVAAIVFVGVREWPLLPGLLLIGGVALFALVLIPIAYVILTPDDFEIPPRGRKTKG